MSLSVEYSGSVYPVRAMCTTTSAHSVQYLAFSCRNRASLLPEEENTWGVCVQCVDTKVGGCACTGCRCCNNDPDGDTCHRQVSIE